MKRFIFSVSVLCVAIVCFSQTTYVVGNYRYYLNHDSLTFTFGLQSSFSGELNEIPLICHYNKKDYKYVGLSKNAFHNCSKLTKVVVPNGTTNIPDYAFANCGALETVILPDDLETIGNYSFYCCFLLNNLVIPEGVTSIGECGLYRTNALDNLFYLPMEQPVGWQVNEHNYIRPGAHYDKRDAGYTQAYRYGDVTEMLTWGNNNHIYDGSEHELNYTCNIPNFSATLSQPTTKRDAGNYDENILVTFSNGTTTFVTSINCKYKISKANLVAIADNKEKKYGDTNPIFSISLEGLVAETDRDAVIKSIIINCEAENTSDVGQYPITLSGQNKNYDISFASGFLTIKKSPLTAKVNNKTRKYGKDNPSFSVSYSGLKNDETAPKWTEALKIETSATKLSDVGTYAITATGVPTNYDLPSIENGTLTITQAPLTLNADNATRRYFEDEPAFTYSCSGFVNDDDAQVLTKTPTFSTNATKTSNVGKYKITPSGAEAKNYAISYEEGELTITKRTLTATSHCSRSYGEENPVLPIEYDGFVNDETENILSVKPTGTTTATKTSTVGNYPITISGGVATNYEFVYEQGVLEVTKAPLSAKVVDATKVYGSSNPVFCIEYYGLKNGEIVPTWSTQPTFQTEATKQSGVGQYAVNANNGIPKNYDLGAITPGTLTITPAPLTIKANNATRQYYSDNPTFSYTCNGFVNNDNNNVLSSTPTLSTSANLTSDVGTYPIEIGGASSPNYSILYQNGTLTIIQRTLTASAGNYERAYNEDNPSFDVIYSGFVGNDNEDVLITKPVASTFATKTSDVGTYPINVSGGNAENYTFTYTPGILTINKAEQTIMWDQDFGTIMVGDQIELKAVASSGLPITYTVSNNHIAEVYTAGTKTYLDCFGFGKSQILAIQEGNLNYYSSPRVRKVITIDDEDAISTLDESNVKIQGTTFGVRVTGANKGDMIRIYTIDGKLQHSVEADGQVVDVPLTKDNIYIIKVGTKTVKLGY